MSLSYCNLFSGSTGNCALVASQSTGVLIDGGMPCREIKAALEAVGVDVRSLSGILVTHEHTDHIKGVGALSRTFDLPVYANCPTWAAMEPKLGKIAPKNLRVFDTGHDFYIADLDVLPFSISHDAAQPVGFCFENRGARVVQMTDLGLITPAHLDLAYKAGLVMIESNHDVDMLKSGPYPGYLKARVLGNKGHLSNLTAAGACVKMAHKGVKQFMLGHLSRENNTVPLALTTAQGALGATGLKCQVCVANVRGCAQVFQVCGS